MAEEQHNKNKKQIKGINVFMALLCYLALEYLLAPTLLYYAWNHSLIIMWPTLPTMTFNVAFWIHIGILALRAHIKINTEK